MESVRIEYLGNSVEMPAGETIVGRDVTCALRFNDPAVSRKHLRFIRRQEEVFVEDLGSSNGTTLNGRKISGALRLIDGDTLRFGSRELVIRVCDSDLDDRSTLVLTESQLSILEGEPVQLTFQSAPVHDVKTPRVTARFENVTPFETPANQRCPSCAAPVTEFDDECSACHFDWGSFRPQTNTERPIPVTRRRQDRKQVALRLVYASSELEIEAMTRDLSESGVFVCSQVLDPVGTKCSLTILLDGGPPLAISGIVRRVVEHTDSDGKEASEEPGLGVQFTDIGPTELAWIRSVLAQSSQPAA